MHKALRGVWGRRAATSLKDGRKLKVDMPKKKVSTRKISVPGTVKQTKV